MGFGWRDWRQLTSSFFYNCLSSVWVVYGKREGHVDILYISICLLTFVE